MMHHVTRENLLLYQEKELPQKKMQYITFHLSSCELCRTRLQALDTLYDAWYQVDSVEIPKGFADRLMAKIHEKEKKKNISTYVHFFISSAATFFLLYAGLFHELTLVANQAAFALSESTFYLHAWADQGKNLLDTFEIHSLMNIFSDKER